mgnify:CR=1 FL=1
MITYTFLQQYWWVLVTLLGALLVFLMFVQGANSLTQLCPLHLVFFAVSVI